MEETISQKVLEKIKRGAISPRPRWEFLLCRFLAVFLVFFLLAVSSLAIGLILELLSQFDLGSVIFQPKGVRLLALGFPYLWLILAVGILALGVAKFLRTRNGYKYRLYQVAIVFLSVSILLGLIISASGVTDNVEGYLEKYVPIYNKLTKTPGAFWNQPENGLISGLIIQNGNSSDIFEIQDETEKIWQVDYSGAFVRPMVNLEKNNSVRIIGEKQGENSFKAKEVRPWKQGRMKAKSPKNGVK